MIEVDTIPPTIARQLRRLRHRLAVWVLFDGGSRLLCWIIALAAIDLLLDWFFRMDRAQRTVLLVACCAAIVVVFYRRLAKPLLHLPADDALCLAIEARHQPLGHSLITAVQLSRSPDLQRQGASQSMVRAVADRAVAEIQRLDVGATLNRRGLRHNVILFVVAGLLLGAGGFAVAKTETMSIWFERNVLLRNELWPQKTYLAIRGVENGVLQTPHGSDFTLLVDVVPASELVPRDVYVRFRSARPRPAERMRRNGRQFSLAFRRVVEPFEVQVRGGDAVSPWTTVRPVAPPRVKQLRLEVAPPNYTRQDVYVLAAGQGPYRVLGGSEVRVSGEADKPLRRATLSIGGGVQEMRRTAETGFSTTVAAGSLVDGEYAIELTDRDGLALPRPFVFSLEIEEDLAPQPELSPAGIGRLVVPRANLPLNALVRDDFGIAAVRLRYGWKTEAEPTKNAEGSFAFAALSDRLPAKEVQFQDAWDLRPLKIPPGAVLTFQLEATDNDAVSGPKTGSSGELLLRVVSDEEFRSDLLRREKEQRQQFESLVKQQDDLTTECQVLAAGVRGKKTFDVTGTERLIVLQKHQRLIGQNTSETARRLAELLAEVRNNRLERPGGPLQRRWSERIIAPLRQLAEADIRDAVRQLDKARLVAGEPAQRDEALTEAAARQRRIAGQMRRILDEMVQTEGFQEAVNLLYEVVESQRDVHRQTVEQHRERIQRFLDRD